MTLTNIIYNQLREKIHEGELTANEQINVSKISSQLNVSRTPVSHATQKLLEEGYLYKDRSRVLVQDLSLIDSANITSVDHLKLLLDFVVNVLHYIDTYKIEVNISQLEVLTDHLNRALGQGDLDEYFDSQMDLFKYVFELHENPLYVKYGRIAVKELYRYAKEHEDQFNYVHLGEVIVELLNDIIDALKQSDTNLAIELIIESKDVFLKNKPYRSV